MLPFSSKKQANKIRHILDEDWQRRRDLISAEHKHADVRKQLADGWKMWIGQDSFRARREAAKAQSHATAQLEHPVYDNESYVAKYF
jgi:hypothetical protein